MVRTLFTAMLTLLLTVALVMCPYSCMHYPRGAGHVWTEAEPCCACGCHSFKPQAPEKDSRNGQPAPKKTCSCPCICKGALSEFPGQIATADFESPDWGPIVLLTGELHTLSLTEAWPNQPEPRPPKTPTGREIRALLASLLL